MVKNPPVNAGDLGLIPELRGFPGEGNGNPLQYSCLENSMDRRSWRATIHRVKKSRTRLSMHAHVFRGRDRCEWRRLEMNSSWVGQPVASAMLGLIPWGCELAHGLLSCPFLPSTSRVGCVSPSRLVLWTKKKAPGLWA